MTNCFKLRHHVNRRYIKTNLARNKRIAYLKSIKGHTHARTWRSPLGSSRNVVRTLLRNMEASIDDIKTPIEKNYFGPQRVTNGLLGVNRLDETHKDDLVVEGTLLNVSFGFNRLTTLYKEHLLDDLLFHDIEENKL